jgi:prevent-host-death family protein
MKSIGIRELGQHISNVLRRVEAGETIEITDRGRAVALLCPIPNAPPLEQLRSAGAVYGASGHIDELPEPLELEHGQQSPSSVLSRIRGDR